MASDLLPFEPTQADFADVIDYETGEIVDDKRTELIPLSYVETFLANKPPIDDAQELRSRLAALCAYYQGNVDRYNEVYAGQLRTERYIGQMLTEMPNAKTGPKKLDDAMSSNSAPPTLSNLGISSKQSSRLQQLAEIPEDHFENYLTAKREASERIIKTDLLDLAKKADHSLINQSTNNEWYTPRPFLDAAHEVMGGVDLDPASNPLANEAVRAARYYTIDQDGYAQPWHDRVWLNPPYGKVDGESNQARWSRRLVEEYRAGNVTEAILLVNAVPGNQWFALLKDFPICFPDSRIRFYNADTEAGAPTHSNALVYFGPNVAAFVRIFSQFGAVMARLVEYDGHVFIQGIEVTDGDSIPATS